jgi:hypothetical protein
LGRGAHRRGDSTAAGGGCRGGAGSGEVGTRGGQQATLGGSTGPRGCARGVGCNGDGLRTRCSGGSGNGAVSSGETAVRRGWKGKTAAFYSARARG